MLLAGTQTEGRTMGEILFTAMTYGELEFHIHYNLNTNVLTVIERQGETIRNQDETDDSSVEAYRTEIRIMKELNYTLVTTSETAMFPEIYTEQHMSELNKL
jgi:hypothetical protein